MTTLKVNLFSCWQILRLFLIFQCSQLVSLVHVCENSSRSQNILRNGIDRSQVSLSSTHWKLPNDFAEWLSIVIVPIFTSISKMGVFPFPHMLTNTWHWQFLIYLPIWWVWNLISLVYLINFIELLFINNNGTHFKSKIWFLTSIYCHVTTITIKIKNITITSGEFPPAPLFVNPHLSYPNPRQSLNCFLLLV